MPAGDAEYIYYGGAALPAPPFTCSEARFMSLPCAGDREAIQDFIERTLNAATRPGRYRALSKYVFLAIAAADVAGSATAPFSGYGTMAETDVGFWIPVTDSSIPASVFWYPAYLFVDNWLAVVGGREIWGFPKALAAIEVEAGDPRDGVIAVSTLAMKKLEPDARAAMAEIFRLAPGPPAHPAREVRSGEGLIGALADLLGRQTLHGLTDLMTQLFGGSRFAGNGWPMIFLKQVRDATSTTAASHRSVITANAAVTVLRAGPSLRGEHCLTLNDFASQPIAADLGLLIGEQSLPFAFCADIDFTMGLAVPVQPG
jgi:hypothetical protein